MKPFLLELLADPASRKPLECRCRKKGANDEVLSGHLKGPGSRLWPIREGIPRFIFTTERRQKQTAGSFGYKWGLTKTYESPTVLRKHHRWTLQRYGFRRMSDFRRVLFDKKLILDAGCGGGLSSSIWLNRKLCNGISTHWIGADISSAIDVARRSLGHLPGAHFVQADIMRLPFRPGTFDAIFSEGVLHHTPSTFKALYRLSGYLKPGGEIFFYVYRKKAPIREYVDDYLRAILSKMPPKKAWERLRPLTDLGRVLAQTQTKVRIRHDFPELGIRAGCYDLQRFVYWHIMKLFWNQDWSFDENHHINFDWYHPSHAHRQTEAQVRQWCRQSSLKIIRMCVEESGMTVRAVKIR